MYQAHGWNEARRVIVVRTEKNIRHEGQGNLFGAQADLSKYEYKAYVTNAKFSAAMIHGLYNKRADCENLIKELKYDYSIDGFGLQLAFFFSYGSSLSHDNGCL